MIGRTISHYTILEKLGEGGMGIVYRAQDTTLDRQVALKFLPPQLSSSAQDKENLIREARIASSLDHPNICAIHAVEETPDGQMFIVMPFYDGLTLKEKITAGPLKPDEALAIVVNVATGLAAAHARGMVHRDIKSANIIVTKDGQTKIMDFGLARLDNRAQVTKQGTVSGTIAYMSPEQARGDVVDLRSDLWSLGVVLYELLTGKVPFHSFYDQAVIYAILNEEPPALENAATLPTVVLTVLQKTLAKDPAKRFQNANELIASTRQTAGRSTHSGTGSSKRQKSIVVLPFDNISPEKENEYISDGLTEEIIANLSKIKTIKVISRTSAMHYKGTSKSLREIAEELRVQYVLEGSVRKHGNNVRISAQLIDAAEDAHMWSEKYNGSVEQLFDIQEKVASEIVAALQLQLSDEEHEQLKKRSTGNSDAYQLYLKGRFYWNKRNEAALRKALELFSEAIELDPGYAHAYLGLADSYSIIGFLNQMPSKEAFGLAKAAVLKALEIEPDLTEAQATLAYNDLYSWNWNESEAGFRKAISLNPGYSTAHQWYGNLLCALNRTDEAIREFGIGHQLDPLSMIIATGTAWSHYYARKYQDAITRFVKVLELDPSFSLALLWLARTYDQVGKAADALPLVERALAVEENPSVLASYACILASLGHKDRAREVLNKILVIASTRYVSAYDIAEIYLSLGEIDQTFQWLERSFNDKARGTALILVEPRLDPIRSDPRFNELLRKMNLLPK